MKWLSWKTLQPNIGPFFWNKEYHEDLQSLKSNSDPLRDDKLVALSYLWKAQYCSETQGFCRGNCGLQLLSFLPPTLHGVAPRKYDKACHHGFSNVIMFVSILTPTLASPSFLVWRSKWSGLNLPHSNRSEKPKEVKLLLRNLLDMEFTRRMTTAGFTNNGVMQLKTVPWTSAT